MCVDQNVINNGYKTYQMCTSVQTLMYIHGASEIMDKQWDLYELILPSLYTCLVIDDKFHIIAKCIVMTFRDLINTCDISSVGRMLFMTSKVFYTKCKTQFWEFQSLRYILLVFSVCFDKIKAYINHRNRKIIVALFWRYRITEHATFIVMGNRWQNVINHLLRKYNNSLFSFIFRLNH